MHGIVVVVKAKVKAKPTVFISQARYAALIAKTSLLSTTQKIINK